jgi:hypothetical protein
MLLVRAVGTSKGAGARMSDFGVIQSQLPNCGYHGNQSDYRTLNFLNSHFIGNLHQFIQQIMCRNEKKKRK